MEIICDMRDALLFYLFYIQNFFLKVHKKNYYFSPVSYTHLLGPHGGIRHHQRAPPQQYGVPSQMREDAAALIVSS